MERCGGDRGKGFFWSVDEKYAQALEEQESKAQAAAQAAASGSKELPTSKLKGKKDKSALLEPPLRRSIKGDLKGTPLPPPLTSAPLVFKTAPASTSTTTVNNATTGVFPYPTAQQAADSTPKQHPQYATSSTVSSVNPYTQLTHWNVHPTAGATPPVPGSATSPQPPTQQLPQQAASHGPADASTSQPQGSSTSANNTASQQPPPAQGAVPDVVIPIVLGVIPPTHPDYTPGQPNNAAKEGYMVLHERTLILDPNVFSGLTKERLLEIERMGARAALAVLTQHMVKALKERRKERNKDRANRKPKAKKCPPTAAPFTNAPLPNRVGGVAPAAESATPTPGMSGSATPAAVPAPSQAHSSTVQTFSVPLSSSSGGPAAPPPSADPGSPLIVVDDSDDEGPAMKKRKLDGDGAPALAIAT